MKIDYLYRSGGKETAARNFNRRSNSNVLLVTILTDRGYIDEELTVDEALELSEQLAQYANDIKEHAAALKKVEEAS